MKLSIAWIFDHIDADWKSVDIKALVERFNKTTAEIEGVTPLTLDFTAFTLVQITALTDHITAFSPEYNKSYTLPKRSDAMVGSWYLVTRRSLLVALADDRAEVSDATWTKSPDIGGGKDHMLPAIECPESLRAGGWKQEIESHDYVLEFENKSITNRPDLWGHRGVAREIAALLKLPLKPLDEFLEQRNVVHESSTYTQASAMPFSIKNSEPTLCKRFAGFYIPEITYTPSLISQVFRLARVDVRAINAIVDATNYVMYDVGQPMHAFDLSAVACRAERPDQAKGDAIFSKEIRVRRGRDGETVTLLDGQNITLQPTDVVIADATHPLSLAGIMGGSSSAVTSKTSSLFVEAACFDPATIRLSSSAHKIRTDASARFEKNLDPEQTIIALKRFLKLMHNAHISLRNVSDIVSVGAQPHATVIHLEHRTLEDRLGITIGVEHVVAILEPLGFTVDVHDGIYTIRVPSWRATKDVTIKEDIIEEIARFFGYANIPAQLPYKQTQPHTMRAVYRLRTIKQHLAYGLSFNEISTYALYDEHFLRTLRWEPAETIAVKNPVSDHWRRLVTCLIPHLFKAVANNGAEHDQLRFFEWGRTWQPGHPIVEQKSLAGIVFNKKEAVDFYQIKAELTRLFDLLAVPIEWQKMEDIEHPWFMPHQTAALLYNNQRIGIAGKVHPLFLHTLTEGDAFIFEMNGDLLVDYTPATPHFVPQSKYPAVIRDVSFLVPAQCTAHELRACIAAANPAITDVQLVDFFEKDTWKNQRSYTFRFVIQDEYKTLTKADVDALYEQVVHALHHFGATIR